MEFGAAHGVVPHAFDPLRVGLGVLVGHVAGPLVFVLDEDVESFGGDGVGHPGGAGENVLGKQAVRSHPPGVLGLVGAASLFAILFVFRHVDPRSPVQRD